MITGRRRLVAPTASVVTLAEMHEQLRLDLEGSPPSHPEDASIMQYVAAATRDIDAGNGWLGRALMPQTWRITLDSWPSPCPSNPYGWLIIPYPPLIEVLVVSYVDSAGVQQTLTAGTDYEVNADGDTDRPHGFITTPFGVEWPTARDAWNAITITFRCGYEEGSPAVAEVPENIKQYVRMVAASMYENREADAINVNVAPLKQFRDAILTERVWGP